MFGVNDVAVLDIGSEKITLFYGNKSVNDTFNVKAFSSIPYAGFADGEWLDELALGEVIQKAIEEGGCAPWHKPWKHQNKPKNFNKSNAPITLITIMITL